MMIFHSKQTPVATVNAYTFSGSWKINTLLNFLKPGGNTAVTNR